MIYLGVFFDMVNIWCHNFYQCSLLLFVILNTNIYVWIFRTKTLEAELEKCQNKVTSLEKELSDALQNNLLELSCRSSGNHYYK